MNSLFKGVAANDAKDLVNFIIMTLHEELNKANKNYSSNLSYIKIDQSNQMEVFNAFLKNFVNENRSVISDIFYGVYSIHTQCSGCKTIKYNFQTYFFLVFPLEEIKKIKYKN